MPWPAHYNHASDRLIRDGGNSPAIWSKADLRPTVLIGLTQAQPAGKIIVRADDDIYRVADLKGRHIGLYKSQRNEKIDHRRATSEHGILAALAVHGLTRVRRPDRRCRGRRSRMRKSAAETPAGIWAQRRASATSTEGVRSAEARALADGRIDALYDYSIGVAKHLRPPAVSR